MTKRQTSIRLSARTDEQITTLTRKYEITFSELVARAIEFYSRDLSAQVTPPGERPSSPDCHIEVCADGSDAPAR